MMKKKGIFFKVALLGFSFPVWAGDSGTSPPSDPNQKRANEIKSLPTTNKITWPENSRGSLPPLPVGGIKPDSKLGISKPQEIKPKTKTEKTAQATLYTKEEESKSETPVAKNETEKKTVSAPKANKIRKEEPTPTNEQNK